MPASGQQAATEQEPRPRGAVPGGPEASEPALGLPGLAFTFPHLSASQSQRAVRHERLPPPLVLPGSEVC